MSKKGSGLHWSQADLDAFRARRSAGQVDRVPVPAPAPAAAADAMKPSNPMASFYALGRMAKTDMNKTEAEYAQLLEARKAAGLVLGWKFHPIRVRLAKNTFYEPDFLVMTADREVQIHEVKGGFTTKEGQSRIKLCAEILPWFRMFKCSKIDGEWQIREFT